MYELQYSKYLFIGMSLLIYIFKTEVLTPLYKMETSGDIMTLYLSHLVCPIFFFILFKRRCIFEMEPTDPAHQKNMFSNVAYKKYAQNCTHNFTTKVIQKKKKLYDQGVPHALCMVGRNRELDSH